MFTSKNTLPTSASEFFLEDFVEENKNTDYRGDFLTIFYEMFLNNEIVINESIAIALEKATGMDKRFWLNAQQTYDNSFVTKS